MEDKNGEIYTQRGGCLDFGPRRREAEIASVSKNTDEIGEGCLFLGIKGERFDGHDFIPKAIENGAVAVMSHRKDETYPVPALYVDDTRQAIWIWRADTGTSLNARSWPSPVRSARPLRAA